MFNILKSLTLVSFLLLINASCALFDKDPGQSFRIVHYNIKELDTKKINRGLKNPQVNASIEILNSLKPDFISFNEIQFDKKGVPTELELSTGLNLKKLNQFLDKKLEFSSFHPANTGMKATKQKNGHYLLSPRNSAWKTHADPVNFGVFPGQYSTGALSHFEIVDQKIISKLRWKAFNRQLNLAKFKDARGRSFPNNMELFDKNFSDITLNINGKLVHIILFHTVPAFGFGNPDTPNFQRNADQIAFLKWYLTGKPKRPDLNIKPLGKDDRVIAIGDWNVDYKKDLQGAQIIKELMNSYGFWTNPPGRTYIGDGYSPERSFTATLDYILYSSHFKKVEGGTLDIKAPLSNVVCEKDKKQDESNKEASDSIAVQFKNEKEEFCNTRYDRQSYNLMTASDHLPLFIDLRIVK